MAGKGGTAGIPDISTVAMVGSMEVVAFTAAGTSTAADTEAAGMAVAGMAVVDMAADTAEVDMAEVVMAEVVTLMGTVSPAR